MSKRLTVLSLTAALLVALPMAPAENAWANTPLQDAIARLAPEQQATLKAYESARAAYARHVDQYWRLAELKRRKRKAKIAAGKAVTVEDYVREQPPVYLRAEAAGRDHGASPKPPKPPVEAHTPIPVLADFLREADAVYGFRPDRVSEDDFMIYYAIEAIRLGLTRDQVVRLYALETGGMGTHDLQSGYNPRTGHAASTGWAMPSFSRRTRSSWSGNGVPSCGAPDRLAEEQNVSYTTAQALRTKAACVRRMIADARKVPESWPAHEAYAKTPNGLGMHALNLDGNVGPWMQVVKLRGIMEYASKKGFHHLNGAQLEMMNLAGPGSGLEMLQSPGRDMPTSNFFERGGYGRNPVVHDKTGAQLLVRLDEIMDRNVQKASAQQFAKIFDGVAGRFAAGGQSKTSAEAAPSFFNQLFGTR